MCVENYENLLKILSIMCVTLIYCTTTNQNFVVANKNLSAI